MLSSTISRQGGDRARRVVVEAVAGVALQAELRGLRRRDAQAAEFVVGALALALRQRVAPGAGVQLDHRRAQRGAGASASTDGSTNIETRMPARVSSATKGFSESWPPMTSRPPSVVRSVRFSGTRQQACGRMRSAMSSICSVAAISKLSGLAIAAFRRRMSSSWMWRRSSRRCAVMPSAPASMATSAARTGSGSAPPRALRTVAT